MKEWLIHTKATIRVTRVYAVSASSEKEAIEQYQWGDGEVVDEDFEYTIGENIVDVVELPE